MNEEDEARFEWVDCSTKGVYERGEGYELKLSNLYLHLVYLTEEHKQDWGYSRTGWRLFCEPIRIDYILLPSILESDVEGAKKAALLYLAYRLRDDIEEMMSVVHGWTWSSEDLIPVIGPKQEDEL